MSRLAKELDLTYLEKCKILDFVRIYGKNQKVEMRRELELLMHGVRISTKYQLSNKKLNYEKSKQPISS